MHTTSSDFVDNYDIAVGCLAAITIVVQMQKLFIVGFPNIGDSNVPKYHMVGVPPLGCITPFVMNSLRVLHLGEHLVDY